MRLFPLLFLLFSSFVLSQEFHDQLALETCNCIENIALEDLTYQQKEIQLGICLIVGVSKFDEELQNEYGKTFTEFNDREQTILFENIGLKMMENCPFTVMRFSEDEIFNEESAPKVELGKISAINNNQFNTVVLKIGDGSLNNFLWLWDFEGSEILIENDYLDKWINIFYIEIPMYNPDSSIYVNYKIIDKIELGE